MRTRILLCAGAATIAAVAAPVALAGRNPQVAGLQVALRAKGLYGGAIDAIRGPLTIRAVSNLQRAHHLRVTGHANRRTRKALGMLGRPLYGTRLLARGEVGWDVAVLQYLLVRHGCAVPVNGYFDRPTERGVRRFQRRARLEADGMVATANASAAPTIVRFITDSFVLRLTRRLPCRILGEHLGHDPIDQGLDLGGFGIERLVGTRSQQAPVALLGVQQDHHERADAGALHGPTVGDQNGHVRAPVGTRWVSPRGVQASAAQRVRWQGGGGSRGGATATDENAASVRDEWGAACSPWT